MVINLRGIVIYLVHEVYISYKFVVSCLVVEEVLCVCGGGEYIWSNI